ncbi:hypothetical protein BDN67DRAFT_1069134 [Paxillus ammoniavirescens]|nr:hypothetical protein BDN67DRAFT_1069134 [Paxillus ammoniavirescens]
MAERGCLSILGSVGPRCAISTPKEPIDKGPSSPIPSLLAKVLLKQRILIVHPNMFVVLTGVPHDRVYPRRDQSVFLADAQLERVHLAEGPVAVDPEVSSNDAENAVRKEERGERADMCEGSPGVIAADKVVYGAL